MLTRHGETEVPAVRAAPAEAPRAPPAWPDEAPSHDDFPTCPDSHAALRPARGMALGLGLAVLTWAVIGVAVWLIV